VGFFIRAALRAAERHGGIRLPLDFEIKEPVAPGVPQRTTFTEHQPSEKRR
jgi:hypothetical protein